MKKIAAIITATILTAACTGAPPPPGNPGATLPSQILDLHGWTLTTPIPNPTTGALEIYPTQLQDYTTDTFYVNEAKNGVVFKTPADGAVQKGAECPRNELRQVKPGGAANFWSTTEGTHTFEVTISADRHANSKMLVIGQVHDIGPYILLLQLNGEKLYVKADIPDGDDNIATLDDHYQLGTIISYKIEASNGEIRVYYNPGTEPATNLAATYKTNCAKCFFKAGSYLQVPTVPGDTSYGQTTIYNMKVS